jgi:hypothetical protein
MQRRLPIAMPAAVDHLNRRRASPFGGCMDMPDRRRFLASSLGAAAGVAAAVTWWERAFGGAGGTAAAGTGAAAATQGPTAGGGDDVAAWRMRQLTAALATAAAHGKPLLVLVVPEARAAMHEAGAWFGAWLTHGDKAAKRTLGLCTVACARLDEVAKATGLRGEAVAPATQAVTMLLVEPAREGPAGAAPVRAVRITPDFEAPPATGMRIRREMASVGFFAPQSEDLAMVTAALRAGLARLGADLDTLAAAARATLDASQQQALAAWLAGDAAPAPAPDLLVRGLAVLQQRLASLPAAAQERRLDELAAAVTAVVVKRQVAGSRWRRDGCGGGFEELTAAEEEARLDGQGMIACGRGIVTPLCERFLDFFTQQAK